MRKKRKIIFIGAGAMAESMISGMLKTDDTLACSIFVTNKSNVQRLQYLKNQYHIETIDLEETNLDDFDVIILAIKPRNIKEVISTLQKSIRPDHLILSIVAGISISYLQNQLSKRQPIIRLMPNTSSAIGESATGISIGSFCSNEHLDFTEKLVNSIGSCFVIPEEKMDIFTGIAGSGPAYMFYFMQYMEKAGIEKGFDKEFIREIVTQMMIGAVKMVQQSNQPPSLLQKKVTSPNGTTEAGIKALHEFGGGEAITKAIEFATSRSKNIRLEMEQNVRA